MSRVRDRQSDSALHKQPWFAVTVAIGSLAAIAIVVLIAAFATKKGEPKKKDKGDEPKTIAEQPTATAIMQAGDGVVTLSASRANVVRGASRQSQGGTALSFRGAGDEVRWELKLHRPAIFQVEVEYASAAESGGRMLLEVSGATRGARIRGTSGINNFRNTKVGHLTIRKSGQHTLVFKTTELPGGQQLLVRAVRLTPTGLGGG